MVDIAAIHASMPDAKILPDEEFFQPHPIHHDPDATLTDDDVKTITRRMRHGKSNTRIRYNFRTDGGERVNMSQIRQIRKSWRAEVKRRLANP